MNLPLEYAELCIGRPWGSAGRGGGCVGKGRLVVEREGGVEVGGGGEAEGGEGGLNSHTLAARGWGVALTAEVNMYYLS